MRSVSIVDRERGKIEESFVARAILPVGRSPWAIAAGYLGLFSILAIPAPFAILCAIIAIVDIRRNPKKHGMGRAIFGLVMGLFGLAELALFAFVIVASTMRS